ncbi:HU family DNA-binding protein [Endozoicomonas sp. GU-1]|uniref:HU family DNA-binding protein n=1 Tax=Endozoicomonas sp. GU-1 TaxID=3009078 RepID=UPI0022B4057F|nr:HU family DNA-binding protein [Endozoicomonas sp. GU-1]WBA83687.1 HU family DNA-binding protein [Endozoicomonas sp. GU-1]WBA86664.1 HU family DNA-binding protein [Endozoicomonas sp. GU-1]
MNKKELVEQVAEQANLSRSKAELVINAFISNTQETLASGDIVQLIGFGTFSVADRAARKGRNPQTGEEIHIPACKLPQFKPGNKFREMIK